MVSDQERLSCDDLDVAVMRRFSDIRWAVCVGAGFLAPAHPPPFHSGGIANTYTSQRRFYELDLWQMSLQKELDLLFHGIVQCILLSFQGCKVQNLHRLFPPPHIFVRNIQSY